MSHTCYLNPVFNELPEIAKYVAKIMDEVKADIVVGRGLSGSLVAAAVNALYGKKYAVVRKDDENHSSYEVESSGNDNKHGDYIIVDDLICTGRTIKNIRDRVRDTYEFGNLIGIVLYCEEGCDNWHEGIPVHDYISWRKNADHSKAAKAKPYGKRFFQGSKRKGYFSAVRPTQNAKNNQVYR